MINEFEVRSHARTEFIDITREISSFIKKSGINEGSCIIFIPHTTAAVTINENADPSVTKDLKYILDTMIPWADSEYLHAEGNSAAHLKSSLVGCSETILINNGKPLLGTWQGIYFCEFDGPRTRKVILRIVRG